MDDGMNIELDEVLRRDDGSVRGVGNRVTVHATVALTAVPEGRLKFPHLPVGQFPTEFKQESAEPAPEEVLEEEQETEADG